MRGWETVELLPGQIAEFPQDLFMQVGAIVPKTSLVVKSFYDNKTDKHHFYVAHITEPYITIPTYCMSKQDIKFWTEVLSEHSKYYKHSRKTKVIIKRNCNGQERTGLAVL